MILTSIFGFFNKNWNNSTLFFSIATLKGELLKMRQNFIKPVKVIFSYIRPLTTFKYIKKILLMIIKEFHKY